MTRPDRCPVERPRCKSRHKRQNMLRPICRQQRFRGPQVWQRRAATLPDQIKRQHVGAQTQAFADITGQPGTQITGAGADDHGVHTRRCEPGRGEGAFGGLESESGSVLREARVHRVGRQDESFLQIRHRQVAGGDAVLHRTTLSGAARGCAR